MKKFCIVVRFQYQSIIGPTWSEWIRVPSLPIVSKREELESALYSRKNMETKQKHSGREYKIIEIKSEQ